jgi:hypothetical protein
MSNRRACLSALVVTLVVASLLGWPSPAAGSGPSMLVQDKTCPATAFTTEQCTDPLCSVMWCIVARDGVCDPITCTQRVGCHFGVSYSIMCPLGTVSNSFNADLDCGQTRTKADFCPGGGTVSVTLNCRVCQ